MPKITYIEFNETPHVIDVDPGLSVMEGAVQNNVPGIDADCGGACSCGTCHVYVDSSWIDKLAAKSEVEASMLEFVIQPRENSRLSCQLQVTDELDGLVVRMPESQH